MTFLVDYSDDWQHVDGVVDAQYTPPGSSTEQPVKARPTELTWGDLNGQAFAVAPGDQPFNVWGIDGAAANEGKLVVAGVSYTVIGVSYRGDGAQQRLICRRHA